MPGQPPCPGAGPPPDFDVVTACTQNEARAAAFLVIRDKFDCVNRVHLSLVSTLERKLLNMIGNLV